MRLVLFNYNKVHAEPNKIKLSAILIQNKAEL